LTFGNKCRFHRVCYQKKIWVFSIADVFYITKFDKKETEIYLWLITARKFFIFVYYVSHILKKNTDNRVFPSSNLTYINPLTGQWNLNPTAVLFLCRVDMELSIWPFSRVGRSRWAANCF